MAKRIVIPKNGLSKEQLIDFAKRNLSICYFIERDGKKLDELEIPDTWPDYLLEKIKEPMTFEDEWEESGFRDTVYRTRATDTIGQITSIKLKDVCKAFWDAALKNDRIRRGEE